VLLKTQVACSQSLSGTGALHLAGSFLRLVCDSSAKVYITEPSWSNHRAVFESTGFPVQAYSYLDQFGRFDFANTVVTLEEATPGSVFVFHACAHNPSGCDPSQNQWKQIASIMQRRELFPLFDAAYLGLTTGNLEEDAFAIRHFVSDLDMEAAICLSFAKSMGLYGKHANPATDSSGTADIQCRGANRSVDLYVQIDERCASGDISSGKIATS
jgi:aspartate aminotransferase